MKIVGPFKLIIATTMITSSFAATAQTKPQSSPFAMRGVELGTSLENFKSIPIPNDDGHVDLQTWCTTDKLPKEIRMDSKSQDESDGIVTCQWFSKYGSMPYMSPSEHWVDLGTGKGSPVFKFINDGTGHKLFEISFYANSEYYRGIYDALSRNYGVPKDTTSPFKTRSGASFETTTSIWSNASSFITLILRCRHSERYCLSYNHSTLTKLYQDKVDQRTKEAASKI